MLRFLGSILFLFTFLTYTAASNNTLIPLDLFRWYGQSSLVVGSFLYIDGGVAIDETNTTVVLTFTIAIDLRESWNTSNIKATLIEKPEEFPLASGELMWADTTQDTIFVFGGYCFWQYNGTNAPSRILANGTYIEKKDPGTFIWEPHDQVTWALRLDGNGNGTWTQVQDAGAERDIQTTLGSSIAMTDSKLYSIAGEQVVPKQESNSGTNAVTSIVSVDRDNPDSWMSTNNPGYKVGTPSGSEYLIDGDAIFTDLFGQNGSLILFGGLTPDSRRVDRLQHPDGQLWDMSSIVIYDIANDAWMSQNATGDIPVGSYGLCAVTATDSTKSTVDIFVIRGTADDYRVTGSGVLSNCIYVLTLPSFVWSRFDGVNLDQDGRNMQTCTNIGRGQLLVAGGQSNSMGKGATPFPYKAQEWTGGTKDPLPNGIGIYDMTNLRWTEQYNASAEPYTRNSALVNVSNTTPFPQSWNSDKVQALFTGKDPGSSKSRRIGAIAGGTIGGVVGIAAIGAAIRFCYSRRKPRSSKKHSGESDIALRPYREDPSDQRQSQLPNEPRVELPHPNTELPSAEQHQELPTGEKPFEMDVADHTIHELDSNMLTWNEFLERLKDPV